MKAKRKYAIVFAFVAAAVLTPPDVISQIGLAIPTILLYEISIYCVRFVERGRAAAAAEEEQGGATGGGEKTEETGSS